MSLFRKINTAIDVWKIGGVASLRARIFTVRHRLKVRRQYHKWLRSAGRIDPELIRKRASGLARKPKISVIVPVYNIEEKWLRKCIDSVRGQIYENWELCIADDASPSPHVRRVLEEYSTKDDRIKVVFREKNGHISAASNSALELATGEFVVLLDHDDELSADALFWVAKAIVDEPNVAMIYSDEDLIDTNGVRSRPAFKPDWSRDLFYSLNLVTHLSAYRTDILRQIGGFRFGMEGSQDYDLALRFIEAIDERQIKHIPRILYHWRAIPGSVALSGDEKPYAHERARVAIREHLERSGINARVEANEVNLHRVKYERTAATARVMVAVLGSTELNERPYLDDPSIVSVHGFQKDTSLAQSIDREVERSNCDVICFVDSKIVDLPIDWIEGLVSFLEIGQIGVVGGKVIDRTSVVVDGPLFVNGSSGVSVACEGLESVFDGNMMRNRVTGNFTAVSMSLMAVRASDLIKIGGFDQNMDALMDADICLRLADLGMRIVSVPYVEGVVEVGFTRPVASHNGTRAFLAKWYERAQIDRFHNPNLSAKNGRSEILI